MSSSFIQGSAVMVALILVCIGTYLLLGKKKCHLPIILIVISLSVLFPIFGLTVEAKNEVNTVKRQIVIVSPDNSEAFIFEVEGIITEVITEDCQTLKFETEDSYYYYSPTDIIVMMSKAE